MRRETDDRKLGLTEKEKKKEKNYFHSPRSLTLAELLGKKLCTAPQKQREGMP